MSEIYDLIIIGSGPAGLSAAIYAQRARLNTLILEKDAMSGGQVLITYEVDNYPGLQGINGFDLGVKFREHADYLGAKFETTGVEKIQKEGMLVRVDTENGTYLTRTILVATGASYAKINVPGEKELQGMGVSYCATCDGAFFKNRDTVVLGGGDVAVEDAIFLSRVCNKVYLVHRRNELRAAPYLQEELFKTKNIEILWDTVASSINGNGQVESISLNNVKTDEKRNLDVQGVFVAVGIRPNSKLLEGVVKLDGNGYAIAGEEGVTSENGIFVAGDVRTKMLRQIVTAISDGANAITSIERYLIEHKAELG